MTSRSDSAQPINACNGWPPRLATADAQEVSRLEFQSLDAPLALTQVALDATASASENGLEEEIIRLREQLHSQADQNVSHLEALQSAERNAARREWDEELAERINTERDAIHERLKEFGRQRDRYFLAVETEVVKLALAIAARILHREANLDPLLLSGVVRVALEKVAGDSKIILRVPASDFESWKMKNVTAKSACPQVVADEQLEAGECLLDTSVGSVALGVAAQLQEIERGFFDLLHQRPA